MIYSHLAARELHDGDIRGFILVRSFHFNVGGLTYLNPVGWPFTSTPGRTFK